MILPSKSTSMKYLLFLFVFISFSLGALAQSGTDTLSRLTQKAILDNPNSGKGNDRSRFPVLFNGFLNLLGTDGKNNLVINPTLYSLGKDSRLLDFTNYRKETFARNTSILLGVSPDSKNQLHINDLIWGVKIIIINNKILQQRDYQKISNRTTAKVIKVSEYVNGLPNGRAVVQKYLRMTDSINMMTKDTDQNVQNIIKDVQQKFNVNAATAADLINGSFAIMGALKDKLLTKSALNFSYNHRYDFTRSQIDNFSLSSDYSFFLGQIPFDITGNFTLSADTSKKNSSLVRKISAVSFGKNITFKNVKWLEVKPAVDYTHTVGPLYKKEKEDSFAASLTARFMINKNFWLPFTVKYDTKGFLGLFSIQYALK